MNNTPKRTDPWPIVGGVIGGAVMLVIVFSAIDTPTGTPGSAQNSKICAASNFEITGLHVVDSDSYFYVLGDVTNHCTVPMGVHLQVAVRDDSGNLMEADDPWPASTRNLAPGEDLPFKLIYPNFSGEKNVMVRPTDVQDWARMGE